MKSFRTFMAEQQGLDEAVVKKGAVAAYALQGRKNGNNAVRSYNKAKQALRVVTNEKSTDIKIDALTKAFIDLLDDLISQRHQVGSVSARVTALTVI